MAKKTRSRIICIAMSKCNCGSGVESFWYFDGHQIELFKGCPKCEADKFKKYRPDIKKQYVCEETIEPEPEVRIVNRLTQWENENQ